MGPTAWTYQSAPLRHWESGKWRESPCWRSGCSEPSTALFAELLFAERCSPQPVVRCAVHLSFSPSESPSPMPSAVGGTSTRTFTTTLSMISNLVALLATWPFSAVRPGRTHAVYPACKRQSSSPRGWPPLHGAHNTSHCSQLSALCFLCKTLVDNHSLPRCLNISLRDFSISHCVNNSMSHCLQNQEAAVPLVHRHTRCSLLWCVRNHKLVRCSAPG